ncbi:MAG: UDP-glucose dehydrogenase family protein [Marmoricola sp.]
MSQETGIGVVGCGYLGATTACCLAGMGFDVIGLDIDRDRVKELASGASPFYEPGLQDLLQEGLRSGRLQFTTDYAELTERAQVVFLCVGTPQVDGELVADLTQLHQSLDELLPEIHRPTVLVGKSTVPVGTAVHLRERLLAEAPAGPECDLVWNPEFLQEGHAIENTTAPDRIVIGAHPDDKLGADAVRRVFAQQIAVGIPTVHTDLQTAEMVKVSANAFLATKISFINAMAEVCDAAGADVELLAEALGHDARIGNRFLQPGLGFGGGCLPKDLRALLGRGSEIGAPKAVAFLREVDAINRRCRDRVVDLTTLLLDGQVVGAKVAALGAAFKPVTDDIRDSPALEVAGRLHLLGADVCLYDPEAMGNASRHWPELSYARDTWEACSGADVVLLLTEWDEFCSLDPVELGTVVAHRNVVDARHCLDRSRWTAAGWTYRTPGVPD